MHTGIGLLIGAGFSETMGTTTRSDVFFRTTGNHNKITNKFWISRTAEPCMFNVYALYTKPSIVLISKRYFSKNLTKPQYDINKSMGGLQIDFGTGERFGSSRSTWTSSNCQGVTVPGGVLQSFRCWRCSTWCSILSNSVMKHNHAGITT